MLRVLGEDVILINVLALSVWGLRNLRAFGLSEGVRIFRTLVGQAEIHALLCLFILVPGICSNPVEAAWGPVTLGIRFVG